MLEVGDVSLYSIRSGIFSQFEFFLEQEGCGGVGVFCDKHCRSLFEIGRCCLYADFFKVYILTSSLTILEYYSGAKFVRIAP